MTQTHRLGLPLLAPGQAQKDITHNEALLLIDIISQPSAQRVDLATPPATPIVGQCWIVASGATGAWSGQDQSVAGWTVNGWHFLVPSAGWCVWAADRGHVVRFDGAAWIDAPSRADGYFVGGDQVLAARQSAIPNPAGGVNPDLEARAAIGTILSTLRSHGLIAS